MTLTFIDKEFKKHVSIEIGGEKEKIKKDFPIILNEAISRLEESGITKKDIRVIDWDKKKLWHLEDFSSEKLFEK